MSVASAGIRTHWMVSLCFFASKVMMTCLRCALAAKAGTRVMLVIAGTAQAVPLATDRRDTCDGSVAWACLFLLSMSAP